MVFVSDLNCRPAPRGAVRLNAGKIAFNHLAARAILCAMSILAVWPLVPAAKGQSVADPAPELQSEFSRAVGGGWAQASEQNLEAMDLAEELKAINRRLEQLESPIRTDESLLHKQTDSTAPTAGGWNVRLGGHVQTDYILWATTDPNIIDPLAENYFNFRRLRLVADGTGYENFDFRLQLTLEPGEGAGANIAASPDVKDAYISLNELPFLGRIRMGNFFVPFSLEQVTNDTNNLFLERSIPTQGTFSADREVGIAAYNCTQDQSITWTTGMFFDSISDTVKARFGDRQGYRVSGRLTWLPYFDEASDGRFLIHTGAGVLHTHNFDRSARFSARPHVQRGPTLVDTGEVASNSFTTGNLELAIVWGRVAFQSEAFLSGVQRLEAPSANIGGAYAHLSYFITGEHRRFSPFGQHGAQFSRSRPSSNFAWRGPQRGWGAWELKARWSYLELGELDAGKYNDMTLGLNWYWTDRARLMFDWIRPFTDSSARFGATQSDLIGMRLDFNW
jgi:phosphate-selective porin OprO and OprP